MADQPSNLDLPVSPPTAETVISDEISWCAQDPEHNIIHITGSKVFVPGRSLAVNPHPYVVYFSGTLRSTPMHQIDGSMTEYRSDTPISPFHQVSVQDTPIILGFNSANTAVIHDGKNYVVTYHEGVFVSTQEIPVYTFALQRVTV